MRRPWQDGIRLGILIIIYAIFSPQSAPALEFPTKPVTLVVPFNPGGDSDLTGRTLASVAVDYLGQPLLIMLKPGGNGIIGTDMVARAPNDGYTLLSAGTGWNSALPAIEGRSKGPDDMEAVCRFNYISGVMCARQDAPFKTFKELVAWIKANPGKLLIGFAGPYTNSQNFWVQYVNQTGLSVRTMTFDGAGPMTLAALGGHIDVCGGTPQSMLPHVKGKKLIPLVYLDKERNPDFPELPCIYEEGVRITALLWRGVLAPKGTPRPIIDKLGKAFHQMTEDKSFKAMIARTGQSIQFMGPDEFPKFWREEYEMFKRLKSAYKK